MDILVELNDLNDLNELSQLYLTDWPSHISAYYTLRNYINWLKKAQAEPLKHVRIYSLNGNWREHGFHMVVDRYHLMIYSLRAADTDIAVALTQLDWKRGYKISALAQQHHGVVTEILRSLDVPLIVSELCMFQLPKMRALAYDLSCPPGFELGVLNVEDAALINSLWYPRQSGSVAYLSRLIELNINVALYHIDASKAPQLVAWCLRCQHGFLATLHVLQSFRRRGLGELAAKALAQRIAALDEDILLSVHVDNVPSNTLFRKLGFERIAPICHIRAYNVPANEVWLED